MNFMMHNKWLATPVLTEDEKQLRQKQSWSTRYEIRCVVLVVTGSCMWSLHFLTTNSCVSTSVGRSLKFTHLGTTIGMTFRLLYVRMNGLHKFSTQTIDSSTDRGQTSEQHPR